MKKNKLVYLLIPIILLVFLTPIIAHADIPVDYDGEKSQQEIDNQTSDEAKTETQKKNEQSAKGNGSAGGVPLKIKEWDLSRYQPTVHDPGMIEGGVNGITKSLFSLQKFIVLTTDVCMDVLFSLKPIDAFADKLDIISNKMYVSLKESFGATLIVFALVYAFYQIGVKGSMREGMRRLLKLFMVLVIGGLLMANMGNYLKIGSNWSNALQGVILGSGSAVITLFGGDGSYADSNKISLKNPSEGTVAIMRNVYFDLALEKPYLLMNYGTPLRSKVDEKTVAGEDLSRSDKLLSFKRTEDGESARDAFVTKEVKTLENESMHKSNVYNQFGIMLIGLISSIALSIPFVAMAFFSFLLSFLILAIGFAMVYMYFLSIIPQYGNSLFFGIGKIGSLFVIRALLSIVVLFVYLTCYIIQSLIPVTNTGTYFANMLILIVLLIVMFVKRNAIVKFITAGKINSVDNNLLGQAHRNMVKPAVNKMKSAGNIATKPLRNKIQQKRKMKAELKARQKGKEAKKKFDEEQKKKEERQKKKAEQRREKQDVKRKKGGSGNANSGGPNNSPSNKSPQSDAKTTRNLKKSSYSNKKSDERVRKVGKAGEKVASKLDETVSSSLKKMVNTFQQKQKRRVSNGVSKKNRTRKTQVMKHPRVRKIRGAQQNRSVKPIVSKQKRGVQMNRHKFKRLKRRG
ncbi:hypothetical protein QJV45_02605 [Listeria booriae]|uniref:CD3337/EF1877 family mobilome membrane protein n=1 Tax=Listeria booriae TaxID=1552123 RepID=UPI00288085D0|nr:hypothetical protein [Listeria booriae]MDT0109333.1 hypothetical protein [Listeria booriae]